MAQSRVTPTLVAKLVKVGKVVLELNLEVRVRAGGELALGEGDDLGGEARRPRERGGQPAQRDPFPVADEVDARGLLHEGLDEGARVLLGGDEGEVDVLFDVPDELDNPVGVLSTSENPRITGGEK